MLIDLPPLGQTTVALECPTSKPAWTLPGAAVEAQCRGSSVLAPNPGQRCAGNAWCTLGSRQECFHFGRVVYTVGFRAEGQRHTAKAAKAARVLFVSRSCTFSAHSCCRFLSQLRFKRSTSRSNPPAACVCLCVCISSVYSCLLSS